MRKGYTILEMIWMTSMVVIFLLFINEPMRVLISDLPRNHRDFQTAQSLTHCMGRLKTDIEAGRTLLQRQDAGDSAIEIGSSGQTITYLFKQDMIERVIVNDPNDIEVQQSEQWTVPHGRWTWSVTDASSLRISCWIDRTVLGRYEKKFYNSHVYYIKGFRREVSGD